MCKVYTINHSLLINHHYGLSMSSMSSSLVLYFWLVILNDQLSGNDKIFRNITESSHAFTKFFISPSLHDQINRLEKEQMNWFLTVTRITLKSWHSTRIGGKFYLISLYVSLSTMDSVIDCWTCFSRTKNSYCWSK